MYFFVFSCAGVSEKKKTDEDALKERIIAYWNYKIKKKLDKTYDFEYPLYKKKRNLVSYITFYNRNSGLFSTKKYEIGNILIEGENATVTLKLRVGVRVRGGKIFEYDREYTDKWMKIEDIWYHVPPK